MFQHTAFARVGRAQAHVHCLGSHSELCAYLYRLCRYLVTNTVLSCMCISLLFVHATWDQAFVCQDPMRCTLPAHRRTCSLSHVGALCECLSAVQALGRTMHLIQLRWRTITLHACRYASSAVLEAKLLTAVHESNGFHEGAVAH